LKIGSNVLLQHFKNKKMFNFVKFMATRKGMTINFCHPSLLLLVFGTGIRDPGSGMDKKQNSGSRMYIPDPGTLATSMSTWKAPPLSTSA
jgi:hypothetical protein